MTRSSAFLKIIWDNFDSCGKNKICNNKTLNYVKPVFPYPLLKIVKMAFQFDISTAI